MQDPAQAVREGVTGGPGIAAERPQRLTGTMLGITAMVAGMAAVICNDTLVKLTGGEMSTSQIMVIRGSFASVLLFIAAWNFGMLRPLRSVWSANFGWRLVGDALATACFLAGFVHMPIADSNAIQQLIPLSVTAGSALFLGEQVGWRRWTAAFAGLIGVLIIIRPGSIAFNAWSILILASVALVTLRDLTTRRIASAIPSLMLALTSAIAVTAMGGLMAIVEPWPMPTMAGVLRLAGASLFLSLGYLLSIVAVRQGDIAAVMPFRYSVVLFAIVSGYLVWGEIPDFATTLGTALVILAGLYTFARERSRL